MNDTPADDVGPVDSPPLRVMVVDDHPMWRDAVERDLTAAGLQIVATAATVISDRAQLTPISPHSSRFGPNRFIRYMATPAMKNDE